MRIRTEKVAIPDLRSELEGYRILHASDIHFDKKIGQDESLWKEMHSNWADVILITGDFITDDFFIESLARQLDGVTARDGVFGILGNHDYYYITLAEHFQHVFLGKAFAANDREKLIEFLTGAGVKVLVNESVIINAARGAEIFLEGTDDPEFGTPKISETDVRYNRSNLKILLSHSPDILYSSELRKKRFDLLLSGHTHGGQVRIPGIGALTTGTHHATRKEAFGLFRARDGMAVNVSAGIGYSRLPLRVNCPAELVRIELFRS